MSRHWLRHVPNSLSTLRIGLAFAFPFVDPSLRLSFVVVALLSEFFDGWFARHFDAVTPLGILLDPIADKLFILATAWVLISEGDLTLLQFFLIAARDVTVAIGAWSVLAESKRSIIPRLEPRLSGKLATTLQFALLVSLFARLSWSRPLIFATAAVSCLSAIDYIYRVLHARFDPEERVA